MRWQHTTGGAQVAGCDFQTGALHPCTVMQALGRPPMSKHRLAYGYVRVDSSGTSTAQLTWQAPQSTVAHHPRLCLQVTHCQCHCVEESSIHSRKTGLGKNKLCADTHLQTVDCTQRAQPWSSTVTSLAWHGMATFRVHTTSAKRMQWQCLPQAWSRHGEG